MGRAANKANRLIQIEQLLLANPHGLTQAEIARRLHVNRSTIHRCLPDLTERFVLEETDDGRLCIDRAKSLVHVHFTLHEALAVHLAARLLATRMDRQNPHAASALRKLGQALDRLAPRLSQHLKQSAELMDDAAQRHDPRYLGVLETLTLAWAEARQAKIWHRSERSGKVHEYLFAPYFIEPYAIGQTTHTIGLAQPPDKLRTFKIERIERAELTTEHYTLPPEFDPRRLLEDAWGIWYTEAEPEQVRLRFHPRVAGRVRETRWHRSEVLTEQPDGSLLWQAQIAQPQEMLPWLRGWGADVEVLGPERLREILVQEARRLAKVYGTSEEKRLMVAHFRKKDKQEQLLIDHLRDVSHLAGQFAEKVGLEECGRAMGLVHDLGKASQEFQNYIGSANELIDPDSDDYVDAQAKKGQVDHSTAGAQILYEMLSEKGEAGFVAAQFLALCTASHHSGLIDCLSPNGANNFQRRIEKTEENTHRQEAISSLPDVKAEIGEILAQDIEQKLVEKILKLKENGKESKETYLFQRGLLARFLLSCLLDADRLNTADFESPYGSKIRNYGQYPSWETLIERLAVKIDEFLRKPDRNEVDELRNQISLACLDFFNRDKGIYQLTVPTGGGKTLASIRFALHHAAKHHMDRIIYVIPYTSIIDQNADEIRKILEDKDQNGQFLDNVVLEHHSNLTPEEETYRQHLLAENWDAPVVFTTQVQFLETLFGSGTRNARKMHQLANSIIIFDEVQTIPINCIHMLNIAIRFLVRTCGASVVLCTATQPPLDKIELQHRALLIEPEQRIIPNEKELFEKLRRVEVFDRRKPGGWNETEISELVVQELQSQGSVLVIVNTRAAARNLFQVMEGTNVAPVFHLSTNMCPAHRLNVLAEVRQRLEQKAPVVCVSTQLIEAGVDIDFGAVIRYLAGLDSVTQAAGRCNRHGRQTLGHVWIVNPSDEKIDRLKSIMIGTGVAQRVLGEFIDNPESFNHDLLGIEAMARYYQYYFHLRKDEMNYPIGKDSLLGREDDLFNLLSINTISVNEYQRIQKAPLQLVFQQSFQTAAKLFRVIDAATQGVIVPYQEKGEEIIQALCSATEVDKQYKLLKQAQRYSVNLFPHQFQNLVELHAIQEVQKNTGIFYLNEQYYCEQFGWNDEIVSPMKFNCI